MLCVKKYTCHLGGPHPLHIFHAFVTSISRIWLKKKKLKYETVSDFSAKIQLHAYISLTLWNNWFFCQILREAGGIEIRRKKEREKYSVSSLRLNISLNSFSYSLSLSLTIIVSLLLLSSTITSKMMLPLIRREKKQE